jgi:tetratricopeptide (TPR) repeat protein
MDGNLTQRIFRPTACVSHEELRQYLSGRMSREGLRRVEDHLLDCPLCSDAVEGCEEAGNHLTDDLEDFEAFSRKLPGQPTTAKVRQLQPGGYLRQAMAVAALLVVGAVAYFSFDKAVPNGPKLYAKYYDAYENDIPISQRRPGLSDVDPNFAQALTAYTQRQFSQANMLFERAMVNQPDNEAVLFFAAMSFMESNKVGKASKYLQTVSSGKGVYAKKAAWYLMLCDLKSGNTEAAKARLDKLVESGDIMVNEAKSLQEEF